MSNNILCKDTELKFPQFVVLKASAGSGKTHALTYRFIQFLLSEKVPKNNLNNILAITFTNNAAKEMKERIIRTLKGLYFNNQTMINDFICLVSLDRERLSQKAGELIDEILNNYSDFNVKTIDSFITSIFKASAVDFGFNTNFEIVLNHDSFMDYSFDIFLKSVTEGSQIAKILLEVVDIIHENRGRDSSFLWDPVPKLLKEVKNIYTKLTSIGNQPDVKDYSYEIRQKKEEIKEILKEIESEIERSDLEKSEKSTFSKILNILNEDRFFDLFSLRVNHLPVKKPKGKKNIEQYRKIEILWGKFLHFLAEYAYLFSHSYYMPYLKVYKEFSDIVEKTKRYQSKIFIGDINNYLSTYINSQIVPDIYFRIGEKIYHFLIDEFQDTSPLQWNNLLPLISNSLAQDGSLFIVGDTKQAIYGFRDADYKIMKNYESFNPFTSAHHYVKELNTNYRSLPEILSFNERIFKEKAIQEHKYCAPALRSGLSDYTQKAKDSSDAGYVDLVIVEEDKESLPQKKKIIEIIKDITSRGYTYGDIAILTPRNDDVVEISEWLSENNIDFVSYSSLDVRRRKITKEIISLLNFFDSPIDDLSFATFITGDIFNETLLQYGFKNADHIIQDFLISASQMKPLYKAFQSKYPELWENFFEELLKLVGYLPLYEITDRIIKKFQLFEMKPEEEASLVKILETVKDFEALGYNSIKDFLDLAEEDFNYSTSKWDIAPPLNINAVKIMTIHQAKGLGFPVVLVLLYAENNKGFQYLIEKKEDYVRLLKITRDIANNNDVLEKIYEEERINEMVNRLNTLYVGFTRAEKELYVIGIKGKRLSYPLDLITIDGYPAGKKRYKESVSVPASPLPVNPILYHHNKVTPVTAKMERLTNLYEKERGEFLHNILSFLVYVDDDFDNRLTKIIEKLCKKKRITCRHNEIEEIKRCIKKVVTDSSIKDFFVHKPGRIVKNEMEIVSSTGELFRIDRALIDKEKITIIEYKTGIENHLRTEHIFQVKNYMNLIKKIYPRKLISGIIAYIDIDKSEIIEVK